MRLNMARYSFDQEIICLTWNVGERLCNTIYGDKYKVMILSRCLHPGYMAQKTKRWLGKHRIKVRKGTRSSLATELFYARHE
jgi:hypothetical protein